MIVWLAQTIVKLPMQEELKILEMILLFAENSPLEQTGARGSTISLTLSLHSVLALLDHALQSTMSRLHTKQKS